MNIQFKMPLKPLDGRNNIFQKGSIVISERANKTSRSDGLPSACKVDNSVNEINEISQSLQRQLVGDGGIMPKTFEQLHSEIRERYVGKEYDKQVAALNIAQQDLETDEVSSPSDEEEPYRYLDYKSLRHSIPDNARKYWAELIGAPKGYDWHYLDAAPGDMTSAFSRVLYNEFYDNSIEHGMFLYDKIRTDLLMNAWFFELNGMLDEFEKRLEDLDNGFIYAAEKYAETTAIMLAASSPNYTMGDVNRFTPEQVAANARISSEAAKLAEHIKRMFAAALAYHKATGSFTGFMDTKEANQQGKLSMRDVDNLSNTLVSNMTMDASSWHKQVLNAPNLNNNVRDYLDVFYRVS